MKLAKSLLALVMLLALVLVAAPRGTATPNPNQVIIDMVPQSVSTAAESYWTPERMRSARPHPLSSRPRKLPSPGTQTGASPSGPRVIASSGGPGDAPQEERTELTVEEKRELTQGSPRKLADRIIEPLAGTFPFTFTSYRLFPLPAKKGLNTVFPYKLIGQVFFTKPGIGDFRCSGSVVNAQNLSLVWTAGHCVFTPGVGFHINFVFAPGRNEGANPFKLWTARALGTLNGWALAQLLEYDHGGAVMIAGRGGKTIGSVLGFLGFLANAPREQHWHVLGYPGAPPFDGEHLHICAAAHAVDDQPTGIPGSDPETTGIGCDMTAGVSGAPWLVDFSGAPGLTNLVNGNASYGYLGFPNELYGPSFGDGAVNLRDFLGAL